MAFPAPVVAEHEPELVFADSERSKKLASAFAEIDAMTDAEVRQRSMPGIAVGVVIDGQLAHFKGAGYVDRETKAPPDPDTVYRIGSITKSFTGLAILALRDEGALSLEDPLVRYLPEAGGLVYPTRDAPLITLREMLTHTSGLPRSGAYEIAGVPEPSEDTITRSLAGYALDSTPGTKHLYSNLAFQLLGLVVHRVSHEPLRAFLAERVFGPLGMSSTSFDGAGLGPGRLAVGYERGPKGVLAAVPHGRHGAMEGAGGIHSSVRDMARYIAFQLSAYPPRDAPDNGPVRRSSVRESHFNALVSAPLRVHLRDNPAKGETLTVASTGRYGYAWINEETCDFDELYWHNGGLPGYSAAVAFLPRRGVGVVVLANIGGEGRVLSLAENVLIALGRTGGLAPRVPRAALPPLLAPALARLLAVYNTWDVPSYKAMLSPNRPSIEEEERKELAGYKAFHGACSRFEPIESNGAREARVNFVCERGTLEMGVSVDANGLIQSFAGNSRGVAAPPAVARASARMAQLIAAWDDAAYDAIFGPVGAHSRAERAAFFASLRAAHGTCSPKSYARISDHDELTLSCDHGGDLRLEMKLSDAPADTVASYGFAKIPTGGACPVR